MGRSSGKVKKVEAPPAAPPVILRWQDLPKDDPERENVIVAPEDSIPAAGKGKGKAKGKGKKNEKETEKPKAKGKKGDGPQLANYIKISEFALACKMCPNPDWHPTFQCPNLTPELKEWIKEARQNGGTYRAFRPEDRFCHICMSPDHWSSSCEYQIELPPYTEVGPYVDVLCLCCGKNRPHPGEPGVDWRARAVLKASCMYGSPEAMRRAAAHGIKPSTSAAANGTVMKASA